MLLLHVRMGDVYLGALAGRRPCPGETRGGHGPAALRAEIAAGRVRCAALTAVLHLPARPGRSLWCLLHRRHSFALRVRPRMERCPMPGPGHGHRRGARSPPLPYNRRHGMNAAIGLLLAGPKVTDIQPTDGSRTPGTLS